MDVDSVTGAGKCAQIYLSQNTGVGRNGTFGDHEVDVDSVTGAGKCAQMYLPLRSIQIIILKLREVLYVLHINE